MTNAPKAGRPAVWPWHELEIGQGFFFPPGFNVASARNVAYVAGKRLGKTFTVRMTADGRLGCWRVPYVQKAKRKIVVVERAPDMDFTPSAK